MLCSTNAIESLNARYRRAIKARGHFPTEQAALKCLYLVTRSLDPTGKGRASGPWPRSARVEPYANTPASSSVEASTSTRRSRGGWRRDWRA